MSTVYLIFRIVCYGALAVVTLGIVGMLVLSHPELCSSFSTGSISCASEGLEEFATLIMGILLVSAFTGIPVLLALLGLFFAVRAAAPVIVQKYRRFRGMPEGSETPALERTTGEKLRLAGKIFAYCLAACMLLGVIAGLYDASFR